MKNKGLIISLIVFAGILVMLLVTIFLINFPDSSSGFLKKNKGESVRPTIEESKKETTTRKQEIGYSIAHYRYEDGINVDIEYPVIYGMENPLYENNINQKINIDATTILLLHEDKDKISSLGVSCIVQSFDEKEIVITYEGEMYYKSTSTKKSSTTNSSSGKSNSTSRSKSNVSGDPNYDTYGGYSGGSSTSNYDTYGGNNYNTYTAPVQQAPSGSYDSYAPVSGQNNVNMYPGANDVIKGFASTKVTSKKIFYTSTINLEECLDVYLSEYAVIPSLVKYVKTDDCELVNIKEENVSDVKKYIQKMNDATILSILQNADYQNKGLTSWPKCFSYRKGDYIYFTLPISHELGDYALIRYSYDQK